MAYLWYALRKGAGVIASQEDLLLCFSALMPSYTPWFRQLHAGLAPSGLTNLVGTVSSLHISRLTDISVEFRLSLM